MYEFVAESKAEIVQEKVSQTELSRWFGCLQSTISKTLSQNDEFKEDKAENEMRDCKRKCTGKANDRKSSLYLVSRYIIIYVGTEQCILCKFASQVIG